MFTVTNTYLNPIKIVKCALLLFLFILLTFVFIRSPLLFFERHARSHRIAGGMQLILLIGGVIYYGFIFIHNNESHNISPRDIYYTSNNDEKQQRTKFNILSYAYKSLIYDILLSLLGWIATLTAAREFPHKHVRNNPGQSGTLSKRALVTQGEMLEHSFYQALNMFHVLYLHSISWLFPHLYYDYYYRHHDHNDYHPHLTVGNYYSTNGIPLWQRFLALWFVTCPWLVRKKFPVHSFSANWKTESNSHHRTKTQQTLQANNGKAKRRVTLYYMHDITLKIEKMLYQIKKWQYVFYKHFILHGLNICMAFQQKQQLVPYENNGSLLQTSQSLPTQIINLSQIPLSKPWKLFWIALNMSYVMEFFLQSLVKKKVLSQHSMLKLQRLLMAASSLAAIFSGFLPLVKKMPYVPVCSIFLNFFHRGHDVFNVTLVALIVILIQKIT